MRQLLATAFFLSASPLVAQQTVSVQSGEHDGFTRLVLAIDPAVDWQVETSRGAATIRFPGRALGFSTARIFDRIAKDRIAAVSAAQPESGAELKLELDCKCEVQSFAFDGKYIVIDVYDGPPLDPLAAAETPPPWQPDSLPYIQPSNAPARFTAYVMSEPPAQPRLLPDPPKPGAAPVPETAALAPPAAPDTVAEVGPVDAGRGDPEAGVVSDMEAMAGAVVSDMNTGVEAQDDPEMLARIEEAQSQLLAQLTRAADQGLVDFVPAPVPVAEVAPEPEPEPAPPPEETPPSAEMLQQLSARTAYAQSNEDALSEIVNQFAMPQCLEDARFSMQGWGGEAGFSTRLAELRSSLLGEFDTPVPDIAESLVQLYLRYGLGAEARLTLAETGVELENGLVYNDMAALLEGEPERVAGPVLQGAGCGGAHEMWYLASGRGAYQVLEPLAITEAFSEYPIEVRALIGPPLAQAFMDRGQVEAGHVVLEIVRRADSGVTTAQRMAEARVMQAQGDPAGAAEIYRTLALESGEQAPEALIAYARALLETDETLPDTLLLDLESAAFFNRETAYADDLRLWEIRVRARIAGADAALAQIEESARARPDLEPALQEIAAEIFSRTGAEDLGDFAYAQMVLRFASLLDQGPQGDAARLRIAEEMAAIGLPETALDVLSPNLSRPSPESRRIEAASYVQLFQPARALEVLADADSLDAYKIRLNAYLQMKDYAAVARLLNEDYASEISVNDVALRAGDWEKIQDAGAVGTLAAYVQGGAAAVPPEETLPAMRAGEDPSLGAARALLAENEKSRQFLEGVLGEGQ